MVGRTGVPAGRIATRSTFAEWRRTISPDDPQPTVPRSRRPRKRFRPPNASACQPVACRIRVQYQSKPTGLLSGNRTSNHPVGIDRQANCSIWVARRARGDLPCKPARQNTGALSQNNGLRTLFITSAVGVRPTYRSPLYPAFC